MLYDLNVVWTPQTTTADLENTLRFSKSLGYDVVALNHIFGAPIPAQITNPIPQIGPVHASFPPQQQTQQQSASSKLPITLRRATVIVSDPATNHRLPLLATHYDILAVRPTTEKAFSAACTSWTEPALISLDLSTHTPFRFKPKPCMAAINRGIFFEICYSQLLAAPSDPPQRARAAFVANVLELLRATKGRGIVLSSEARAAAAGGTLRAPADVVNLFAVWGLGPEKGLEALGAHARAVVVNEGLRRRGFRGVVDVVEVEGQIPGREKSANGEEEGVDKKGGKNAQKKKGGGGGPDAAGKGQKKQQQQQQQQGGNGKRKHDGGGDQGLPVMSKRQAKKMKVAEKNATNGSTA